MGKPLFFRGLPHYNNPAGHSFLFIKVPGSVIFAFEGVEPVLGNTATNVNIQLPSDEMIHIIQSNNRYWVIPKGLEGLGN
jgi:hypothetical protein